MEPIEYLQGISGVLPVLQDAYCMEVRAREADIVVQQRGIDYRTYLDVARSSGDIGKLECNETLWALVRNGVIDLTPERRIALTDKGNLLYERNKNSLIPKESGTLF